jgi:tRNA A37 threonylcarbamoyladenosine dehydratase
MDHPFARTEILIGQDGLARLAGKHVLVVGLGGVGGAVAEAVGRAGVGRMTLLDHDVVTPSNLNRQLAALHSTIGRLKTDVMAVRLRDINPALDVILNTDFLYPDQADALIAGGGYDHVADCIDSIASKAALVAACLRRGVPVISALGAGNCLDAGRVRVTRLDQTQGCPLARELRHRLRALGASLDYPVVYTDEPRRPALPHQPVDGPQSGRPRAVNGTISYLPPLFGFLLAGVLIRHLLDAPAQPDPESSHELV